MDCGHARSSFKLGEAGDLDNLMQIAKLHVDSIHTLLWGGTHFLVAESDQKACRILTLLVWSLESCLQAEAAAVRQAMVAQVSGLRMS